MNKRGWIILAALVVLLWTAMSAMSGASRQADTWQYRIVALGSSSSAGDLDRHGADGWEAVAAVQDSGNVIRVLFKRRGRH